MLLGPGCAAACAAEGFLTATFGDIESAQHRGTLQVKEESLRFDLSALPSGARFARAVLRFPFRSDWGHHSAVKLVPIGVSQRPLPTAPPAHRTLDATKAVRVWAADASRNKGLKIVLRGRADFHKAVLEVGYLGDVSRPLPVVSRLTAEHRCGQTLLTWREPWDVVGKDQPTFEEFEKAVLDDRAKREVVYRVYRHGRPITPANLGEAELVRTVPATISCWNLLAIANTEHPQQRETKRSPLRGGNLRLNHVMTRYRIDEEAPPLDRATGLAVLTTAEPGRRYYAVTVSIDGQEAVAKLKTGENLTAAVEERPAKFPAIVRQRTRTPEARHAGTSPVDVYVCWVGPPYALRSRPVEVYLPRWKDLPKGSTKRRLPLYVNLGTYGCSATELSGPIWHGARRHVRGAVTVGLAEEGKLWAGDHECLGTLRSFDEGVVVDYAQNRALAVSAWAVHHEDLFVDPQRVYVWGQFAGWALRHGDVYAAVMSNGHNNFKSSREARKHAWRWGPSGGGKNTHGVNHLDYCDLATWVRENPGTELPYWVCWPAYGAFPDHTLGDFGFKPWQEFITAMQETRRAFAAVWMSNGPGLARGVRDAMVPKIKLGQSLPAFSRCSLDTSPSTKNPKGSYRPGKYDEDFQKRADKEGGINLYQRWDPETMADEPGRWEVTLWLAGPDEPEQFAAPVDSASTDVTPRRCRRFRARPGDRFTWTVTGLESEKVLASGKAVADRWGLVTIQGLPINKKKHRVAIRRE